MSQAPAQAPSDLEQQTQQTQLELPGIKCGGHLVAHSNVGPRQWAAGSDTWVPGSTRLSIPPEGKLRLTAGRASQRSLGHPGLPHPTSLMPMPGQGLCTRGGRGVSLWAGPTPPVRRQGRGSFEGSETPILAQRLGPQSQCGAVHGGSGLGLPWRQGPAAGGLGKAQHLLPLPRPVPQPGHSGLPGHRAQEGPRGGGGAAPCPTLSPCRGVTHHTQDQGSTGLPQASRGHTHCTPASPTLPEHSPAPRAPPCTPAPPLHLSWYQQGCSWDLFEKLAR